MVNNYIVSDIRNKFSLIVTSDKDICFHTLRQDMSKFEGDKASLINHLEEKFNINIIIPKSEELLDLSFMQDHQNTH